LSIRVLGTDQHVLNMRARMPFRYGIVTMTALPHLFLRAEVEVNGRRVWGVAADHLPPKWFTKDPATSFRDDLVSMMAVIDSACAVAAGAGRHQSVFDWWMHTYQAQMAWGGGWGHAPLLTNFGTSLVERAVIDAFCRAEGTTFARSVRRNDFGIRLGSVQPELAGAEPADLLPAEPLRSVIARHTVGMTDPLSDADVAPADRVTDGLPQSLEACVRAYGLTHFKIKLCGDAAKDLDRLTRIADVLDREAGGGYAFTLDANENFSAVDPFRELWASLIAQPALARFLSRLIFVEQPLHRDAAMTPEVGAAFARWPQRPPVIIDESDAKLTTAREALELGYAGTSHKNCKGVFKGLTNACLIEHRNRADRSRPAMISGEDLSNVGPVALLQDLAVASTLGIPHVERNGHHYFKGITMVPPDVQSAVVAGHPDLYRQHENGFVTLYVKNGRVATGSVVDHGFGLNFEMDPAQFTPVKEWSFQSLGINH
jgi:hypothetical protein